MAGRRILEQMALERYSDPFVGNDVGPEFGTYLTSFATEHHLVEVHLFQRDGTLVAYVTKSHGVPVAEAQRVANQALAQYAMGDVSASAEVVYDGYSLGRSGSL